MKLNAIPVLLAASIVAAITLACAAAPVTPAPAPGNAPPGSPPPQPTPVSSVPVTMAPRTGSWSFSYAPGTHAYSIQIDASVAPLSDTTQKRQLPRVARKTTITIAANGDEQVLDPTVVLGTSCDSSSALLARAQQIIRKLPGHFSAGDSWRDSTMTTGCRGSIPAESTVISNYLVLGDTILANATAVVIHRIDSLSARGEGADGQHRIGVSATGTGNVNLYFDITSGRLVESRGSQNSLVTITTSGRAAQFIQHVTELITLAGAP